MSKAQERTGLETRLTYPNSISLQRFFFSLLRKVASNFNVLEQRENHLNADLSYLVKNILVGSPFS